MWPIQRCWHRYHFAMSNDRVVVAMHLVMVHQSIYYQQNVNLVLSSIHRPVMQMKLENGADYDRSDRAGYHFDDCDDVDGDDDSLHDWAASLSLLEMLNNIAHHCLSAFVHSILCYPCCYCYCYCCCCCCHWRMSLFDHFGHHCSHSSDGSDSHYFCKYQRIRN